MARHRDGSRLLSSQQLDGTEVEVEILRRQVEHPADVANGALDLHQRLANGLRLLLRHRPGFHPPDGLAFHELADELDERQDELDDRPLDLGGLGTVSYTHLTL